MNIIISKDFHNELYKDVSGVSIKYSRLFHCYYLQVVGDKKKYYLVRYPFDSYIDLSKPLDDIVLYKEKLCYTISPLIETKKFVIKGSSAE